MIKEEKNKKLFMICMSILLVLVLVIGGSYAWFTLQLNGTKTNVLRAGTLSLKLDDENSVGISQEKAVPMLDEVGEQLDPYHFTLINEGDQYVEYTIYFDDNELEENETRMPDNKVKYNLVKDTRSKIALLSTLGENPNRVLDHGTIKGGQTITYDLRLWIDSEASNEVMGQVVRGKLRVVATQVTETVVNEQNLSMSVIGGNGISFSEGVNTPLTDEEGAKLEPYYFSLKNTSGEESEYTVTLEDASAYRMRSVSAPNDKIKYQLKKNNEVIATDVLSETIIGEEKVLDTGVMEAGSTNNYELRLWIDSSVSEEEASSYSLQAILNMKNQIITTQEECFAFDKSTGTITDYLCIEGNTNNLPILTEVIIPSTIQNVEVKKIGKQAFYNNNIEKVKLPSDITEIESAAFGTNSLTKINIPSSVISIGSGAFSRNKLTQLDIPNSVVSIGSSAFEGNQLTNIIIPSSVTSIGSYAFINNQLPDEEAFIYNRNSDGSINRTSLNSYGGSRKDNVIVPDGVQILEIYCLSSMGITSVMLPDSLITIKGNALSGNRLTSITIPKNVTTIEAEALNKYGSTGNPNLTKIINKTGRSFDWKSITHGNDASNVFVTGTITNPYGNITVSAS